MCASGDIIEIMRFTSAPKVRPVAVRISKVEDLASYLRWLPWRRIKSQSGPRIFIIFFLKMKRNEYGLTQARQRIEKARLMMKKPGKRSNFLETNCMSQTDSESRIR